MTKRWRSPKPRAVTGKLFEDNDLNHLALADFQTFVFFGCGDDTEDCILVLLVKVANP
jgi:hypothetical protein